jgi:F-type H+-transporting ATPase subunit delta
MAAQGTIARPYAQAVFELAHGAGTLAQWSQFLQLAAVVVTEPDVQRLLRAPGADLRRLVGMIAGFCREQLGNPALLAEGERSLGENFLRVLVDNRRLETLPAIATRFDELKAEAENTLEVTLTSATEISAEQRARIEAALKQRFGRQIRLGVQVDAALIGGARLQVGDRVIDGTVRTGLDKLATALRV